MTSLQLPFRSPRRAAGGSPVPSMPRSSYWLFAVLIVQFACQLGLLAEFLSPFRVVLRSGAFGVNLIALIFAAGPRRNPHHPAYWVGLFCLMWVAAQIMNPDTNTILSAVASVAMITAVTAPLFWVPRLQITPKVIRNILMFLWGFHTLSASFGVLQVYFPGRFQLSVSSLVKGDELATQTLSITLAGGETVLRPMGLTDTPGGAAYAGLYAFVFGLGLFALSRRASLSIAGVLSLPLGLFCIYLSEVRVLLVLAVIISIAFAAVLSATGRFASAIRVGFIVPVVVAAAFVWAVALGGESTMARFETLVEENPDKVFYKNRGHFLEDAIDLIPEYPFGAGLGRWGMMSLYFGDPTMEGSSYLWSEVQWTSWIYDGGFILMFGYPTAILIAIAATARIATIPEYAELSGWALLIVAYDIAILAFTFSFPAFSSQTGVEFWLLNAMIWTAARQLPRRPAWRTG